MKNKLIAFDTNKTIKRTGFSHIIKNLRDRIRSLNFNISADELREMGLPIAKALLKHRIEKGEIIDFLIQYDNLIGFIGTKHKIKESTFYFRTLDTAPLSLKATSKSKLDIMLEFSIEKIRHNGQIIRPLDNILYNKDNQTCRLEEDGVEASSGNTEIIKRASFSLAKKDPHQFGIRVNKTVSGLTQYIGTSSNVQVGDIQSIELIMQPKSKWNYRQYPLELRIDTHNIHIGNVKEVHFFSTLIGIPDLFHRCAALKFSNISAKINSQGEIEEVKFQYEINYFYDETIRTGTFRWHPEIEPPSKEEE
ncbi:MAG: hypothetical protein HQ564_09795 [Candidatus Saganbacteria bacterium]|nr:hypothetical protein [Candidatus Saganbacteria bacterium]